MQRFFLLVCALLASAGSLLARDIKTVPGQIYRGVTVTRIEKTGIAITHRDGAAFLDFSILPPEIRKEFGYTEDAYSAAVALQQQQQAATAEYQRRVAAESSARAAEAQLRAAEARVQALTSAAQRAQAAAEAARAAQAAVTERQASIAERDYTATDYTQRDYGTTRYSSTPPPGGPIQVRGYFRKDGTYVRPHTRRR